MLPGPSPTACCAPCACCACPADYLEEDEDLDEEGMAEDMQDVQRQRMLGGRGRAAYDEDEEEERAARLAAAKAGSGAVPGGKRRRIEEEEEEDEEEISGAEEDDEEGAEEMKVRRMRMRRAGSALGGEWGQRLTGGCGRQAGRRRV